MAAILRAKGIKAEQVPVLGSHANAVKALLSNSSYHEHRAGLAELFNMVKSEDDTGSLLEIVQLAGLKDRLDLVLPIVKNLVGNSTEWGQIEELFVTLATKSDIVESVLDTLNAVDETDVTADAFEAVIDEIESSEEQEEQAEEPVPAPTPVASRPSISVKMPMPTPTSTPAPPSGRKIPTSTPVPVSAPPAGRKIPVLAPAPTPTPTPTPVLVKRETKDVNVLSHYLEAGNFVGHVFKPSGKDENIILSDFSHGLLVMDVNLKPPIYPVTARISSLSSELVTQFIGRLLKQAGAPSGTSFKITKATLINRTYLVSVN